MGTEANRMRSRKSAHAPGKRSRARLRARIIAGCRVMAEEYLAVEREFHPLEEEVHRAIDVE
jgi:hypothetical protein